MKVSREGLRQRSVPDLESIRSMVIKRNGGLEILPRFQSEVTKPGGDFNICRRVEVLERRAVRRHNGLLTLYCSSNSSKNGNNSDEWKLF